MGFLAFLFKIFLFYMFFRFVLRLLLGPVAGGFNSFGSGRTGRGRTQQGRSPFGDNAPPKQKKPSRFQDEEIIEGEFEEIE